MRTLAEILAEMRADHGSMMVESYGERWADEIAAATAWRSMESAPKDGTEVLIADAENGVCCAIWHTFDWYEHSTTKGKWAKTTAWCVANAMDQEYGTWMTLDKPLAWQPKPEPPQ